MKILVSGAGGYIGSNIAKFLSDAKYDIFAITSNSELAKRRMDFLNLPSTQIDICDNDNLSDYFAKCRPDVVLHFAALKQGSINSFEIGRAHV